MQRYYSGIFWHFTGAPLNVPWHRLKKPSEILDDGRTPKPDETAVEIVKKILGSKKLRATCTEKIDYETYTCDFCCVTDIPLKDLPNFARFYGRVAIGFRHDSIHKQFFPVWYIPPGQIPFTESRNLSTEEAAALTNPVNSIKELCAQLDNITARPPNSRKLNESEVTNFTLNRFKITEFSVDPEETFYSEREWRKLGDFNFDVPDVAAVVVPEKFIPDARSCLDAEGFRGTSLFAWEIIELA